MKFESVGSYLPSDQLYEARENFRKRIIDASTFKTIENEAVVKLVERQLQLGLPRVTSGELRREYWNLDFWFGLNGISKARFDTGGVYQNEESGTDLLRITGKIGFNSEHPFFEDIAFLKEAVGDRAVCMQCLPSPTDLYLEILLMSNGDTKRVYPYTDSLLNDIAIAYNKTLREFHRHECRSVQLDDTSFGRLCQDNFTKRLLQGGIDLIALHETLINLINASIKDLPNDMEISMYLSGGDIIVPEWEHIEYPDNVMPKVLRHVKVDKFYLPMDLNNDYQFEILRHVPKGKEVALGLLDAHTPYPEDADSICLAVSKALTYLTLEILSISPRTGFKLTNHQKRGLTFEDQWNKLGYLKDIAEGIIK